MISAQSADKPAATPVPAETPAASQPEAVEEKETEPAPKPVETFYVSQAEDT